MTEELNKIKKHYGEKMAHMCRELFPTILEQKGLLYHIILAHFPKSKQLYEDIIKENKMYDFKNYIYFLYDEMMDKNSHEENHKSVRVLLKEKGYTLYECKTNEDIQRFRKYYANGEELCTFRDPYRINNHYIFFIIKEGADTLNRKLFPSPKREDEYSVSVLDLQFDKGKKQRVSIKSRYNHTVSNPDATYSNNLENIAEGLTDAFEKEYGFKIGNEYKVNFELANYVLARDGKYYKYNHEINNIHYCHDNIIIDDGEVIDTYIDKSRYTFMDYFILDTKEKKIILYDPSTKDSFVDGLSNITGIEIINEDGHKKITLKLKNEKEATIILDNSGRIISYENQYLQGCGNRFLYYNKTIQKLNLPNLLGCGDSFIRRNENLRELSLPKLQKCGAYFLYWNRIIHRLDLPSLKECGPDFLFSNESLTKLSLPNLQKIGHNYIYCNLSLEEINLPKLQSCGDQFLMRNRTLQEVNLPNLQSCGDCFLYSNRFIQKVSFPKLQQCSNHFLESNKSLQEINLPNLKKCGCHFLGDNIILKTLSLPSLLWCGNNFLFDNEGLQVLNLPNLQECGEGFLRHNKRLETLSLPNLRVCKDDFLFHNKTLQALNLPNLQRCGNNFVCNNKILQTLSLPNLQKCGNYFLLYNELLQEINISNLQRCGVYFLYSNKQLQEIELPNLERHGCAFMGDRFEIIKGETNAKVSYKRQKRIC